MTPVSGARRAALEALLAFERGRPVDEALEQSLAETPLTDPRDRALATELAYGAVRRLRTLDHVLAQVSARPLDRLHPQVRAALRLAAYQLLYLDRVPAHAAVHQAVAHVSHRVHRGAGGYVNAVLRALITRRPRLRWPAPEDDPAAYLGVMHAHPDWIVRRWLSRLGFEETEALCAAGNASPELVVRVNRLRARPPSVAEALERSGARVSPGRHLAEALRVHGAGPPHRLPGFAEGCWTPQDEASMLAARVLAPEPGERVLDACAAPGTKSTHMAELMGDEGEICALDADGVRLPRVEADIRRLGLRSVRPRHGDARRAEQLLGQGWADRALVDAPCSGLGTLARRPDLRWRKRPEDVVSLAGLQREILEGVAPVVRPGGVLVYSTCTTEPEENDQVVDAFLAAHPEFRPDAVGPYLPETLRGTREHTVQLWPHRHGTDGFFIARLRRWAS